MYVKHMHMIQPEPRYLGSMLRDTLKYCSMKHTSALDLAGVVSVNATDSPAHNGRQRHESTDPDDCRLRDKMICWFIEDKTKICHTLTQ